MGREGHCSNEGSHYQNSLEREGDTKWRVLFLCIKHIQTVRFVQSEYVLCTETWASCGR